MAAKKAQTVRKKHPVVSREKWLSARKALLAKEKAFTKRRDALARERRKLPWVRIEKTYSFDGPSGKVTLRELFGKKGQLFVYHFMFTPSWDAGCPHCSFWADHYSGTVAHLAQRDTAFAVISRAPIQKIEAFKKRMGWTFPWVSSGGSDFNYDFGASFRPEDLAKGKVSYNFEKVRMDMEDREGASAFLKDESGAVYHTYSCFARGIDLLNGTYNILDLTAKGRDEDVLPWTQAWVRHHDRYTD